MGVRRGKGEYHGQRGQVVPILAVVLVLAGILAIGLVHVAVAASQKGSAEAAAEAAALAGAAEGPGAARQVASENDARVVNFVTLDADVVVTVVRRGIRATARARWTTVTGAEGRGPRRIP